MATHRSTRKRQETTEPPAKKKRGEASLKSDKDEEEAPQPMESIGEKEVFSEYIIPRNREEKMVVNEKGQELPQLTFSYGGYSFELTVGDSPLGGKGVWMSCKPNSKDAPKTFRLAPGKLIHLGSYGPLLPEDKKTDAEFEVKNFVFEQRPEKYAFDSNKGHVIDITDDRTGRLHDAAKKIIFPFFNEQEGADFIHVELRPGGSVHFFLGHRSGNTKAFEFPVGGSPVEVFIHCGLGFIENADQSALSEIRAFKASEFEEGVYFLAKLANGGELAGMPVQRMFVCVAVLKGRALQLGHDGGPVNVAKVQNKAIELGAKLYGLVQDADLKDLYDKADVDGMIELFLERNKEDTAALDESAQDGAAHDDGTAQDGTTQEDSASQADTLQDGLGIAPDDTSLCEEMEMVLSLLTLNDLLGP